MRRTISVNAAPSGGSGAKCDCGGGNGVLHGHLNPHLAHLLPRHRNSTESAPSPAATRRFRTSSFGRGLIRGNKYRAIMASANSAASFRSRGAGLDVDLERSDIG